MEALIVLLFVPTMVFLVVVAPLWIVFHYISKRKLTQKLTDVEQEELQTLSRQSMSMEERLDTLEAILDSETPGWRQRTEESQ